MTQKVVTKEELYKQINSLLKDFEVIGPRELAHRGIFYETVNKAEDLYLGESFTTEPVKKFFLSPSEWFFRCQYKEGKNSLEEIALPGNKRIIIGARPCEARGLTLLDKVFDTDEYKDKPYLNNRQRTILVGLSCLKPDRNCFCTSLGGSPVDQRGLDALIFPAGGEFIIEVITEAAAGIFASAGKELSEEEKMAWEADKEKRKGAVEYRINTPENLDKILENAYWQEVSRGCLSCGICTFLCPTCHCFDLVDEERKRLRCYDGCAFPDFTQEASGVNPRPGKKERYRQRVYHKFAYFKKNFGENLCVGCGRCIRFCPVKINIAEVADKAPLTQ